MEIKSPVINNIVDAFKVLDEISNQDEIGISSLASTLNLPKSTVFRIIKSLEEVKAIRQLDNANYTLDYRMLKYAKGIYKNSDIVTLSYPYMKKAVSLTGENISLSMQHNREMIILNRLNGEYYQLQTTLRPVGELYCSGMGKLFLSQWSDAHLKAYFKKLPERTINTITTFDEFKKCQAEIKSTDISIDNEEYEYGLTCYAIPITDKNDKIIYAISISGPTTRLQYKGIDFLVDTLKKCAQEIKEELIIVAEMDNLA